MPTQNRRFGAWGEHLAEDFLRRRAYEILDRNFQKRCGEIDLICRKDGVLHFIEVKTRTRESVGKFGLPQDAVTKSKQRKLVETALAYLAEIHSDGNIQWQIDVITIICSAREGRARLTFIENAVEEG